MLQCPYCGSMSAHFTLNAGVQNLVILHEAGCSSTKEKAID